MKKTIFITGVSGGIGSAVAKYFKEKNWHVIGADLVASKDCDEFFQGNVSDEAFVRNCFSKISKLDSLVNNAAIQVNKSLLETSAEDWDRVMAENVKAAFLCSKYAHAALKAAKGAIVNVSSVHAVATSKNIAAYATSKGALTAFSRAAALEFGADGIRVNALLPGAIRTPMLEEGLKRSKQTLAQIGAKHPVGRAGEPAEIAHAVMFLSESTFMTGQNLVVDGGALIHLSTE